MKTQHFIRAGGFLLLCLVFQFSFASGGSVMGQVTDADTKEPLEGATVVFESQGTQKDFTANEHGFYYASNLPAGIYTVIVGYLSRRDTIPDYKVSNEDNLTLDLTLGTAVTMKTLEVVFRKSKVGPIIDPLDPRKDVPTRDDIKHMPITSISGIAETKSGVVKGNNGEYYVRGSRAGGLSYYIDGCLVMGSPDIPLCGLDTYRTYTGFIPPKYGDTTGGVVVMKPVIFSRNSSLQKLK